MPYVDEDYPTLARTLRIWSFPRAHFRHVARLPYRWVVQVLVLFAHLRPSHRVKQQCSVLPHDKAYAGASQGRSIPPRQSKIL